MRHDNGERLLGAPRDVEQLVGQLQRGIQLALVAVMMDQHEQGLEELRRFADLLAQLQGSLLSLFQLR